MLSVFSSPGRYTQGKNATQVLGQEMDALGLDGPALILAGKTAVRMLLETWRKTLGDAGIPLRYTSSEENALLPKSSELRIRHTG